MAEGENSQQQITKFICGYNNLLHYHFHGNSLALKLPTSNNPQCTNYDIHQKAATLALLVLFDRIN